MKSAEKQDNVKFEDFVGEFFLIWFFPFGIWKIQPRITNIGSVYETFRSLP